MIKTIVFSSLAIREVEFYIECAKRLRGDGYGGEFLFLSFCEPANHLIERAGFRLINAYSRLSATPSPGSVSTTEREFGIENLRRMLTHEQVTFGVTDTKQLLEKFCRYLRMSDQVFADLETNSSRPAETIVFQELGGFIASMAPYFAAKKRGLRHVFFEPSFYRGRIVPVLDSLMAVRPAPLANGERIDRECLSYLKEAKENRTVVIPSKDRHHFHDMGLGKVFNKRNLGRLTEKLKQKYMTHQHHEFEHVATHTRRSFEMLMNRMKRNDLYSRFEDVDQKFVYFPLHVERDYSLTIRSTPYYDQLALLRLVSRILPNDVLLLAKEHPASIGGFDQKQIEELCTRFDNFRLIHPGVNSYEILSKASCILTINSKVGAEALLMEKPVISMGDAFYSDSPLVLRAENPDHLERVLTDVLAGKIRPDFSKFEAFFGAVWESSFAGELYVNSEENVSKFCRGLQAIMRQIEIQTEKRRSPAPSLRFHPLPSHST